jgi:beta-glucosidase
VSTAVEDGIDVRGFFHWTGVDNYEWDRGFTVPFGLFDADRAARASVKLFEPFAS